MNDSFRSTIETQSDRLWKRIWAQWSVGGPLQVECWLKPDEIADLDEHVLIDLLYCEFCLRCESGESPTIDEYLARFPSLELPLRRQLMVHRELVDVLKEASGTDAQAARVPHRATIQPSAFDSTTSFAERCEIKADPPTATGRLPDSIGEYRVIELLGSGTQAEVYRAVHPVLGRDVVIKRSRHRLADDPSRAERFLTEGRSLAQLRHANLVQIYDVAFDQGRPYLVMEYVSGETLDQYARRVVPTARRAALLVAKIARAVGSAHIKGIMHRDIKPTNVLIDSLGEPRLLDFGLARVTNLWDSSERCPSGVSGTPAYMAPEQARGHPEAEDRRSDIFALGGLLYFLLTRRDPIVGDSLAAVLERARQAQWDRQMLNQSAAPRRLRAICEKAMAANPNDRYADAEQLANQLEAFASGKFGRRVLLTGALSLAALATAVGIERVVLNLRAPSRKPNLARDACDLESLPTDNHSPANLPRPRLSIRVWRDGRFFDLVDVVPVQPGDEFRITTEVPPGLYSALFSVNGRGEMIHLAQSPAAAEGHTLHYPKEDDHTVPLVGPPGTEFLFACGRRSGPVAAYKIEQAWKGSGNWPNLPEMCVWRLVGGALYPVQRPRDFGTPVPRPDPEGQLQDSLQSFCRRVRAEVDWLEGIVYCLRGKP